MKRRQCGLPGAQTLGGLCTAALGYFCAEVAHGYLHGCVGLPAWGVPDERIKPRKHKLLLEGFLKKVAPEK